MTILAASSRLRVRDLLILIAAVAVILGLIPRFRSELDPLYRQTRLLQRGTASERLNALGDLVRVGDNHDEVVVPALLWSLRDEDDSVRVNAAYLLSRFTGASSRPEIAAAYSKALDDPSPKVVAAVALYLPLKSGKSSRQEIPRIIAAIRRHRPASLPVNATAMSPESSGTEIRRRSSDPRERARAALAFRLTCLLEGEGDYSDQEIANLSSAFQELLDDPSPEVRLAVANWLSRNGPKDSRWMPVLQKLAGHTSDPLCEMGLLALPTRPEDFPRVLPILSHAYNRGDLSVSKTVLDVLERMAQEDGLTSRFVAEEKINSTEPLERSLACWCMDLRNIHQRSVLIPRLKDPDPRVRALSRLLLEQSADAALTMYPREDSQSRYWRSIFRFRRDGSQRQKGPLPRQQNRDRAEN